MQKNDQKGTCDPLSKQKRNKGWIPVVNEQINVSTMAAEKDFLTAR
ncbi:MAG: hypothetical protein R3281_11830 [Balneolaceae bacterium]|nr:hypothetical protein [Balneolaceae bacterium]